MRDLFDIFPDLPWARHRSLFDSPGGVANVQRRALAARAKMTAAIAERQRKAQSVRQAWLEVAPPGRRLK